LGDRNGKNIWTEDGFAPHYEKLLEYVEKVHMVLNASADIVDQELEKYDAYFANHTTGFDSKWILFKTSEGYLDYLMTFG
jgi:hypothetical protein